MRITSHLGLALALALPACNNPPPPAAPAAFDRPESLDFFCWDLSAGAPVELSRCDPAAGGDVDDGDPAPTYELHAVVTQTTTGEVAALQITGDEEVENQAGPIDSDVRIPGFTFAPVGEVPSAVVTPSDDPAFTYVVSRGSSELHVIDTASFRSGLGADVRRLLEFPSGARPSAMVLSPDEDELIIALPELGEVWFVPIDAGNIGTPVMVALGTDVPPAVDLTAIDAQPPEYIYTCGPVPVLGVEPLPPRAPVSLGATPRPWSLVVDEENGRVLVADEALPVVHVIDVDTHAELEGINVGVPTQELALTPPVPARPGDTSATERFLYAIDATFGATVLAVDYTQDRDSFGAVLTVSPTTADRLELPFPAQAIEVVTPGYDASAFEYCDDANTAGPSRLRGVFLAVATTDGSVRIFDVFDLDSTCRGDQPGCAPSLADDDDDLVAIARHRPRIGVFIDELVSLDPEPAWVVNGNTTTVQDDGTVGGGLPGLAPLGTCPPGLGSVFGESLVCAVADPWAATSQRYVATWEGTIPFTGTSGANITEGTSTIAVPFDPCAVGVIGSGNVPGSGGLSTYGGDMIAITGALPPSLDEDLHDVCAAYVEEGAGEEITPILLPILDASVVGDTVYPGALVVGDPIRPAGVSFEDVARCYPELLEVEVRGRGAFVVASSRAGFRSSVVEGADGRCEVDPARYEALERGRAFPNELFATPEIAFRVAGQPLAEDAALELSTANVPRALSYDVSFDASSQANVPSLLVTLRWNPIDQRLYAVDQARRGVVRLDLLDPAAPIEAIFR